ncbi:MAG: hypothetical protein M1822_001340 [Bathelium mastoideum]|nr:MAG: hypothetical protein M1822_001340 [Bathelium mastoideum]
MEFCLPGTYGRVRYIYCLRRISPSRRRFASSIAQTNTGANVTFHPIAAKSISSEAPKDQSSASTHALHHYVEGRPPNALELKHADRFFAAGNARFLFSASQFRTFPSDSLSPEVAFLGRSNVGKSSLLNALLNRSAQELAHVSSKPGRTRTMNVFAVGGEGGGLRQRKRVPRKGERDKDAESERWIGRGGLSIVDMPGYGKGSRDEWGEQILKYLCHRKQMRRAFLLVDAEHGLKNADSQLLDILHNNYVPHQIILSKVDKILGIKSKTPSDEKLGRRLGHLRNLCKQVQEKLDGRPTASKNILFCSAEKSLERGKKLGIDAIRWAALSASGLESDEHGRPKVMSLESFV